MLKLAVYEDNILEFLSTLQTSKQIKAVCPSPAKADIFRDLLIQSNHGTNIQVETISNFVKSNLAEADSEKISSKSSLLLELWTIWKLKISNDYTDFRRVFDLFTEIRSFSCELHLLEELDPHLKDTERRGVHLFYQYLKTTNKLDEQDTYNIITDVATTHDIILWGYDHLNANQIEMFKRIGNIVDVHIPIPNYVYTRCKNIDWPFWISTEEFEKTDFVPLEIRTVVFPENRASEYLDGLEELGIKDFYYLALDSELTPLSIASKELYYKSSIDIFTDETNVLFEELIGSDFKKINEKIEKELSISLKDKLFIRLKILIQLKELFTEFTSLSKANENLIIDDFFCLREKLALDLPRTSWITLADSAKQSVLSSDYLLLTPKSLGALFITKSMAKSFQGQNKFPPELRSILQSYGPIQSKNVLLNTMKFHMYKFSEAKGLVFIEDNAFEHLLEWEDISTLLSFKNILVPSRNNLEHNVLTNPELIQNFRFRSSATALQSYLDCPRKYYHSYIDSLDIGAKGELTLTPDILGTIEHFVIESSVTKMKNFDNQIFEEIVYEVFNEKVRKLGIALSKSNHTRFVSEVLAHTQYITNYIIELRENHGVELFFEYDLSLLSDKFRGRVDLLIKKNNSYSLVDFKRSKSSIPSATSFNDYKKIQLWYYLSALDAQDLEVENFGYISLSNLDDSLIFTTSDNSIGEELSKITKLNKIEDWESKKNSGIELIKEIEVKIKEDEVFAINPTSLNVCSYCVASPVCPKTILNSSESHDE